MLEQSKQLNSSTQPPPINLDYVVAILSIASELSARNGDVLDDNREPGIATE